MKEGRLLDDVASSVTSVAAKVEECVLAIVFPFSTPA